MGKIVNLSEAASIALHSMVLIARSEKIMSVPQIAEETGTSKHHVVKILQRLVKENYLASRRGPSGGFSLRKKPETISLLDIYEAVEGRIEVAECPLDRPVCSFDGCILDNIVIKLTEEFREHLTERKLAEYL